MQAGLDISESHQPSQCIVLSVSEAGRAELAGREGASSAIVKVPSCILAQPTELRVKCSVKHLDPRQALSAVTTRCHPEGASVAQLNKDGFVAFNHTTRVRGSAQLRSRISRFDRIS